MTEAAFCLTIYSYILHHQGLLRIKGCYGNHHQHCYHLDPPKSKPPLPQNTAANVLGCVGVYRI